MNSYTNFYCQFYHDLQFEKEQFDFLFNKICDEKERILEIGAGNGRTISMYYNLFKKIDLIEPNKEMSTYLNQYITENNYNEKCKVHNISSLKLPFPDETFDVVTIPFLRISEMSPFHFTLSEVFRVLKKEGVFYFHAFNPDSDEVKKNTNSSFLVSKNGSNFQDKYINLNLLKSPHLGEFGFELNVNVKGVNSNESFNMQQWCPSLSIWQKLFKTVGFEVIHLWKDFSIKNFDLIKDNFVTMVLKKNSSSSKQVVEVLYDQMSGKYESIVKGDHYKVPIWLKENFSDLPKKNYLRWLDIGCGSGIVGDILKELQIKTSTLDGLDLSEKMLIECQKKNIYNHLGKCDLNIGVLEVKPRMYDVVSAIGVLEFVKDFNGLLQSLRNIMETEGLFYFTFEKTEINPTIPDHINFNNEKIMRSQYTSDQIIKMFSGNSFEVLKIQALQAYLSPSINKHVNYYIGVAKKLN